MVTFHCEGIISRKLSALHLWPRSCEFMGTCFFAAFTIWEITICYFATQTRELFLSHNFSLFTSGGGPSPGDWTDHRMLVTCLTRYHQACHQNLPFPPPSASPFLWPSPGAIGLHPQAATSATWNHSSPLKACEISDTSVFLGLTECEQVYFTLCLMFSSKGSHGRVWLEQLTL